MITSDRLRLPSPIDLAPDAYKDWLHINLFDLPRGRVGILNLSLHGDPRKRSAVAVGTALLRSADNGWWSRVEVRELHSTLVHPTRVEIPGFMAITLDPNGVEVRVDADDLQLDVVATAAVGGVGVEQQLPFGSGWISWRVEPRMQVVGDARLEGQTVDAGDLLVYHDHNWGRWHWGDDAGWTWSVLTTPADTFVLAAITDRHRRAVRPRLWAWLGHRQLVFAPESVRLHYRGVFESAPLRLPGAMAALHGARRRPRLPAEIEVVADDRIDRVTLTLTVEDACQLITADPARPGYGFIHEMSGPFRSETVVDGRWSTGEGMGVFELVD